MRKAFADKIFDIWGSMIAAANIHVGDKLGLYKQLDQSGAVTIAELADMLNLKERWVREWLEGQAAYGFVDYLGEGRFHLNDEQAAVLAREGESSFMAGLFTQFMAIAKALERMPEAFKTGIGFPFDARGIHGIVGSERVFAPWYRSKFLDVVLPSLEGVVAKLERGAKVADIGCGAGVALCAMAERFPNSQFYGYEISHCALSRAEANKQDAGVSNLHLCHLEQEALPQEQDFDLIITIDCLHDMTHPEQEIAKIFKALKTDGTWFVSDMKVKESFEENLEKTPMLKHFYGASLLCCLPSGAATADGAALGALGLSPPVAERMAKAAGFSQFKEHDFQSVFNSYFEIRP